MVFAVASHTFEYKCNATDRRCKKWNWLLWSHCARGLCSSPGPLLLKEVYIYSLDHTKLHCTHYVTWRRQPDPYRARPKIHRWAFSNFSSSLNFGSGWYKMFDTFLEKKNKLALPRKEKCIKTFFWSTFFSLAPNMQKKIVTPKEKLLQKKLIFTAKKKNAAKKIFVATSW